MYFYHVFPFSQLLGPARAHTHTHYIKIMKIKASKQNIKKKTSCPKIKEKKSQNETKKFTKEKWSLFFVDHLLLDKGCPALVDTPSNAPFPTLPFLSTWERISILMATNIVAFTIIISSFRKKS